MHIPELIRKTDKYIYFSEVSGEEIKKIINAGIIHKRSRSPEKVPRAPMYGFIRLMKLDIDVIYREWLNLKSKETVDEITFMRSDIYSYLMLNQNRRELITIRPKRANVT